MFIPPQGVRHAATLLLTNRLRGIPHDASPQSIAEALGRLAHELVALAEDTRVSPEARDWLIDQYGRAIDRLPYAFDVEGAKSQAGRVIAAVGVTRSQAERRDLFLIYVPEDRLPLAAPLAIELTKRRVSVAFSEYEVATQEELAAAVAHGLSHHGAGVILQTRAFEQAGFQPQLPGTDRLRVQNRPEELSTVEDLSSWAISLKGAVVKNHDRSGQ
jgi:hypothetical protein